jgi:hypothetical protein
MKYLYKIILLSLSLNTFGQNESIKEFTSQVFFGYEITKKPAKIESSSFKPIDYGESYEEKNIIKFTHHPLIKSKIEGQYNVKYFYEKDLFENYGVYQLNMTLVFDNYNLCKETLEKLKSLCRKNAAYKNENLGRENGPKSENCIYNYEDKLQLPRITLDYHKGPNTIQIKVFTTYSFNKFRNFKGRLW